MDNMQRVGYSLKQNTMISDAVKGELESLIAIFNKQFPSVSLDNLASRLNDLQIIKGSKYYYRQALQYVPSDNKIFINQELLQTENVDAKHAMMKMILSMITAKDNYYGFGSNRHLTALNIGVREIMANNLVGNDKDSNYIDEQVLTNGIGQAIGLETLLNGFFNNDPDLVMKKMLSLCSDVKKTNYLLENMNNNMQTREAEGISRLFFLQKDVLSMYGSGYNYLMMKNSMETGSNLKYMGSEELGQFLKTQPLETKEVVK